MQKSRAFKVEALNKLEKPGTYVLTRIHICTLAAVLPAISEVWSENVSFYDHTILLK